MSKKIINFSSKQKKARFTSAEKGLTLVEIVVALAIMGILTIAIYSNFRSTTVLRELDGAARDVQTSLQKARFQAVRMRMNHRVSFVEENSTWCFNIEREDSPGVWNAIPGSLKKSIPKKINVTVNFPSQTVVFSPLGFISNYNSSQNDISLQSAELQRNKQPDLRVISVYAGGAIKYAKTATRE